MFIAIGKHMRRLFREAFALRHISVEKVFNMTCVRRAMILIAVCMFRTAGNPQFFGCRLGIVEFVNHTERNVSIGISMNKKHWLTALGKLFEG